MKKLFRFRINVYTGVLLTFISLTGAGCGVWHDFTTYFNLYYNLSDLYSQAETAIKEQKRNLFDLEEVPISGNASALLNQVIEKSSKLLQFNGESSFVDNALFMLGKSFYYMQNYQKALRKFDELIIGQPNSSFVLEGEFWAAKTQLRLRNFDDGLMRLKTVKEKALAADDGNVLTLIYIEEIKYQLGNRNYVAAVDLCKSLIQYDYDSGISAEACFELGKLYQVINQYNDAVQAFRDVNEYSPTYELALNANVELGRALREVKEYDAALEVFQKLRREAKYSDKYDVVDLEIGISQMNLGNYRLAMSKLRTVDTSFAASVNAGIARFYIGKILEENYKLYDSASVFYKKSASSSAPPEIQAKAQSKVTVFTKYNTIIEQLNNQNKQLGYLKDTTLYIRDSIQYAEDTAKAASEAKEKAASANRRAIRGEGERGTETQTAPAVMPGGASLNLKAPVYPKMTVDSLNGLIVKTKYDLGSLYFAELNQVDSAVFYYNDILTNYSDTALRPQTLFALGNCYQTLNRNESADSIYNYIYENYRTNPVVNSAAVRINKPKLDLNFDPGKNLFIEAEKLMLNKEYSASIKNFYDIYKKHPTSSFAPKALLASGWILENNLKMYDSAAVMYDSVLTKYPQSQYAMSVKGKMDVYKLDRSKKKSNLGVRDSLAIASDSLKALNKDIAAVTDSAAGKDLALQDKADIEKDKNIAAKTDEDAEKKFEEKRKNVSDKDKKKVKGKASLADLNDLERIKEQIAEAEKKVLELRMQKAELFEKIPGDPAIKDALKQLLETKANLEKLPK